MSHGVNKTLNLATWSGKEGERFNRLQKLTEQLGNPRIWANVRPVLKSTAETM